MFMMLSTKAPKSIFFQRGWVTTSQNLILSLMVCHFAPLHPYIFVDATTSLNFSYIFQHAQLTKPTFCWQCTLQNLRKPHLSSTMFSQPFSPYHWLFGAIPLAKLILSLIMWNHHPSPNLTLSLIMWSHHPSPNLTLSFFMWRYSLSKPYLIVDDVEWEDADGIFDLLSTSSAISHIVACGHCTHLWNHR